VDPLRTSHRGLGSFPHSLRLAKSSVDRPLGAGGHFRNLGPNLGLGNFAPRGIGEIDKGDCVVQVLDRCVDVLGSHPEALRYFWVRQNLTTLLNELPPKTP
jgi:hypothetical protein